MEVSGQPPSREAGRQLMIFVLRYPGGGETGISKSWLVVMCVVPLLPPSSLFFHKNFSLICINHLRVSQFVFAALFFLDLSFLKRE